MLIEPKHQNCPDAYSSDDAFTTILAWGGIDESKVDIRIGEIIYCGPPNFIEVG